MIWAYWSYRWYIALWCIGTLFILWWRYIRTIRLINASIAPQHQKLVIHNWSPRLFFIRHGIYSVALLCLAVALLRPQGQGEETSLPHQGRDLVVVLDISRSMLAQDCKPDRLQAVKEKIVKLTQQLTCDRIGLILFAGTAILMCPLTSDYQAFLLFLQKIDVQTISSGTTALDQALQKVIDMYDKNSERKNKLVLVATDGEDFSASLTLIKDEIIKKGIHIVTLGLGTPEGAPIPVYDDEGQFQGHLRDEHGTVVISRLNEPMLQSLARDSHALYLRAQHDDTDVAAIMSWLQSFEKEDIEHTTKQTMHEYYYYPAALSLLLCIVEWLI